MLLTVFMIPLNQEIFNQSDLPNCKTIIYYYSVDMLIFFFKTAKKYSIERGETTLKEHFYIM